MLTVIRKNSTALHTLAHAKFDDSTIFFIHDSIQYQDLDWLLEHTGQPKYIVNDNNFGHHGRNIYSIPLFLEYVIRDFQNLPYSDTIESDFCFNFSINKKFDNRNLLLKLVEYFQLQTGHYTWSGVSDYFNMSNTINELKHLEQQGTPLDLDHTEYNKFYTEIVSPCKVTSKIIYHPSQIKTNVSIENFGSYIWLWCNGFEHMFQRTAVSLIGESVGYQKISCVTEKTLFAWLGLTFPIWIGGYGTADACEKAGLDVFKDVIDHSYQYRDTLIERCYYAFKDNIKLLTDPQFAQQQRNRCGSRLLGNREKILNGVITDYCYKTIKQWPQDLQQIVQPLINNPDFLRQIVV